MKNYILSSTKYYSFTAIVRKINYLDAEFKMIEDKFNSVFMGLEIQSNSGVETLIVPPNLKFNDGDMLRLFFEKYSDSQSGSLLERELNKIDIPDIVKVVRGGRVVSTYFPFGV